MSQPKVGPRLKVSVPNFRRTDFSGEIDRLGGLGSARRASAATSGQLGQLSTSALSARCAPSAPGAAAGRAYPSSPKVQSARGPLRAPAASSEEEEPQLAGPALEEWLKFIRTPRATDEASAAPASSRPAPGAAGAAEAGAELPDLVGAPLETFDSAEDFEVRSPEEWIELCRQTAAKPQACVLQFVSLEWTMSACWVHSYDAQSKRYLVELEDGLQKRVKRLALRFNAEDPANFARRVETCRAKKAHCELQQAFIAFIQGQSDDLVSPMKREHKEQFIRQCLHKSHVDEAINYVTTIRKLILEIEQNYVLSTKFAKVKADFTGRGSSRADSPFAALLQSFQPPPAPALGLVPHEEAELPVPSLVDHFSRLPTLSTVFTSVTLSVWTRFLDEVSRHRVLDTTRCGRAGARASTPRLLRGTVPDPDATVFEPDSFFRHMEDYRRDVAVTLERHWRDYIVSEVLDKMAEGSNFFVDNSQKHLRMPLHRILRKFDLILSSQMREFISRSLEEWVDFVRSFVPNPSQTLPVPLLRIRLTATSDEVVVLPAPSELIAKLLELIDDVTKVTDVLATTEPELVPFCSLPGGLLFELRGGDQQLERAKAATEEVVRHCLLAVQEVQAQYQEYAHLLQEEVEFLDPLEVEDVRERAARYVQAGTAIEKLTAPILRFPLFEVSCQEAIQTLSQRAYHLAEACLKQVAASVQERSEAVLDEWADAQRQVLSSPEDEEELAKLKDFMANIKEAKTKPLMQTTRHIHSQIDLLSEFSFEVEPKVIEQAFTAFFWPQQIQIDVAESERSLDSQKSRFMDKLDQERKDFDADMAKYQEELLWLKELDNYSMAQKVSTRVSKLQENLQGAKERVQKFAQREKLFNMEGSDYSQLDVMLESFEPYNQLWTSAIDFRHFQEETLNVTPLNKLDAAEIEALVEDQFRESYKTIKAFEGHPKPQAVAKELRDDIMSFRKNMPVVQAVCQEAFQAMHLAALFEELDVDMDIDDGLTLQGLLDTHILNRIEIVQRISAEAQKQFSLKAALATMKREWKPVELEVIAYKESGTYVIRGTDDIQALLDDHIVKTQGIRGSPFVKPIEKEVKDWEAKLLSVQDLLEQWLMVQRSWLYLEPIFMSDDIQRQMPGESKRFEGANTLWRTTMKLAVENPNMLDISDIEGLLPGFTKANQELELIQKGLNDYLETKRLAFPRFFFLSNDELLMILSQTKDPTAVQPHMSKCFEGINSIRFDSSKTVIQAMLSVEGEVVELAKPVNVNEGDKKGNVEKWLLEVQTSMIDCLTQVTDSSIKAYATTERTKWILEWPGQVALCVDNIYWTQEVTEAIDGGSMDDYVKVSVSQLNGLVNLVRADLTKLARQTLSAVVTIDVHNRDVVMGLAAAKVHSSKQFDWIQQLRYYWRTQGSIIDRGTGKKTEVDKCEVSIINATLYYGFEYLGNSDRLVITPLTDRCYRTLMGAFHLYYGGGPEGPAGTGKTESTKDLAKAVAVQCVVFNCSDGLDYIAMAKFFKGLASSGAWCCFDEFNRINLEVLSVVSQQVQTIQFAIRDKKKVFIFEGTEIQLVPTCAVNITMNPGYAGRSELPDNLKALFRPCAMMVPDYALIGEIVLYSFGFEDAKNLARKAVGSLRLGSEQLSSQDHYDFGMRALKSILVRAGALRRLYGSTRSEEVLALSALSDVNLPKFTANDIPLFKGITGDLFPGVALPPSDYGALIEQLEGSARALTLQPKESFIKKCIQLWETIMVRHGLMLVGQTMSGKTEVENVLSAALAAVADGDNYLPVESHKINPKSINQGQLYGDFDENTHEWTDGILALVVRHAASADRSQRQWILLDGPVDAVWIENMNTVLDDNKKLCLNSGEIIKLSPVTTMMFEVEDLAVASPATVSRCGMVFLEQVDIGWRVLLWSWCERLPERLRESADTIQELFEDTVDPLWEMVQRKVRQPVPVSQNWLVSNLLKLYLALLRQELPLDPETKDIGAKEKDVKLELLFWLALVWSFGAVTDREGQQLLSGFIRDLMAGAETPLKEPYGLLCAEPDARPPAKVPIPPEGSVFDYFPNGQTNRWDLWTKQIVGFEIPKTAQMHAIIVPTADTVRNAFFLQTLVRSDTHVLFSGPTGTGKTVVIQQELLSKFDPDHFNSITLAFSAQTSANQTQDVIDGKLDKRRKGTYGPPLGRRCLVFVDDLNMPAKETYGAQPPIELLRQWMDTGGWYERKTSEFRSLVDLTFIGAMGPPGAGRPYVTPRYQRHFNYIFVVPFEQDSLQRIYTSIMQWFLSKFPSSVSDKGPALVKATIEIYEAISAEMLPTPAKSHYTFNLRDLSKVNQGLCLCTKQSLKSPEDLVRCWAHECQRVFQDRLVNDQDCSWFLETLKTSMQTHFKLQWGSVVKTEPLIFADFADSRQEYYQEVASHQQLSDVLQNFLMDYNQMAKRQMELVLFLSAVEHVCRIVRVLKTPLGNALLVGVGGSGRKSLATLATFVADYESLRIEISKSYGTADWHDDIRRLLMRAGGASKEVTFLLADTQIPKESFLEDVSSLLNNGEVPNLFSAEDKAQVLEVCSAPANQASGSKAQKSQSEVFAFFTEQCRRNMHLVLALSPIGEAFRRRVRMFPAIVNCCTIDWFKEWPDAALRDVADHFLHKVDLPEDVFNGVVEICVSMQTSVFSLTKRFHDEVQRHYYVTPTSYLELINAFKDVLRSKRDEVLSAKHRYDEGLQKLLGTEEQVTTMSAELEEQRPILKKLSAETAELMTVIEQKQAEATAQAAVVRREEEACSRQAEEATSMKEDCQADLNKALPALSAALEALNQLKKENIVEVKMMKSPPQGVVNVSKALCWCFDVKPKKVTAADGRTKIDDYWEPSKKSIWGDPKLLERLLNYDKDNIPEEVMAKLKPLEDDPDFEPEVIKKASVAAFGVCKWVRAMIVYDQVAKVVGPKKAALESAQSTLTQVMAELSEKKRQLKEVQDNVESLRSGLRDAKKKKDDLAIQVDDCSRRLVRAEKLITGLGGEKTRWTAQSESLGRQYANVTGNVLLSSGIIAYLGTFMGKYRQETIHGWVKLMQTHQVPASSDFGLRAVIGDEVQIRQWVISKLPNDQVSIENALILQWSRRWPLMIDPQLQANNWVRKMNAEQLKVVRLSQPNYARELEISISLGKPVLLENVGEALDPLLEPLLQKAVFKAGNVNMIRLGETTIEYSEDFRFFLTTKLPNPHYSPEVCVQVTLLNFMATPDGLEDQMLGILVAAEEPETEKRRIQLVVDSAESKAQLKVIEDRILEQLSSAKGNILDDEELINTLSSSKATSQRIEEKVIEQEKMQAQVQETRANYVPVAVRASALFFVVADLCHVEPMYQYSLEWFYGTYRLAIATAEKFASERNAQTAIQKRLQALHGQFLSLLFEKTCDSLFEKDKLMFSLLLCFKCMEVDGDLNAAEKQLLLLTLGGGGSELPKPDAEWLTDVSWSRVCVLDRLGQGPWQNFAQSFKAQVDGWKDVFDADSPTVALWPGAIKDQMTPLQRALVMLAIRPDCTVMALQEVISTKLGAAFLEPPSFNLDKSFAGSSATTPLIFVLSSGADPMAEIVRLAQRLGMGERTQSVSLGQGQGAKAEGAIAQGREQGLWVILQNCHLAPSWMQKLEVLVEDLNPEKDSGRQVSDAFRLWLTSMPSPQFPVSVLQNGLKMTNEPPKGLKSNLLRAYLSFDDDWFEEACLKSEFCQRAFRKMLFGLCFFHALIQERCSYGALGWNIPYQFSEPDRQICVMQLKMFLEENAEIPYAALRYTAAEANYGGRVTDVHDRRCINYILTDFYCPDILKDEYKFSPSGKYYAPPFADLGSYVDYIRSLPINHMPEAFGLHANANLVAAIGEAMRLLQTACSLQPRTSSGEGGKAPDAIMLETSGKFLVDLPKPFDTEEVDARYPVDYNESMNTVLSQELLRFSRLLRRVRSTLTDVGKAVQGLVAMDAQLEEVANGILVNATPSGWKSVSYPSLKPLASYVADLCARLAFFQGWIDRGIPGDFWLSGFFFTQSFLTGQLQNYARKFKLPIDTLIWNFKVLPRGESASAPGGGGCVVHGMFVDGARWDDAEGCVAESLPKVLFSELPHVRMIPCEAAKDTTDPKAVYPSPIYKTSERKGVLSTTGHSTNFVTTILLPISKQHDEKYWTKRGVACLTQLDD